MENPYEGKSYIGYWIIGIVVFVFVLTLVLMAMRNRKGKMPKGRVV